MGQMKTPGVYIVEKNAFPNSVVQVPTAVPVFIGHTATADNGGKSLLNKPMKITSMAEYINYFGGAPKPTFSIKDNSAAPQADTPAVTGKDNKPADKKNDKNTPTNAPQADSSTTAPVKFSIDNYTISQSSKKYTMYYNMLLFFQNGGGPCYILSIGDYTQDFAQDKFIKAIDLLVKEQEPTMIVMPEIVNFSDKGVCYTIQQHALLHCGSVMQNRVSILDVHNGAYDRQTPDPIGDPVNKFREGIGINFLDYSAAYYPWLNTTIVDDSSLSFLNLDDAGKTTLKTILTSELVTPIQTQIDALSQPTVKDKNKDKIALLNDQISQYNTLIDGVTKTYDLTQTESTNNFNSVNRSIIKISPAFNMILKEIKTQVNLLPPSAAMAGIYTMVDNNKGVWKAPANVSLNSVTSPAVNISHYDQEDLNVPLNGKSVNAIRSFIGEGVLVWGARTMDGNSLDWRYISVRRTLIMLEQSIKIAAKAYVFEPNVANTWVTIKSMVNNFLTGVWKQGGLAGAVPTDAFSVHVGLGETMTADDILEGIMRITVLVAVSRPAEFIEITFQQQMQKS